MLHFKNCKRKNFKLQTIVQCVKQSTAVEAALWKGMLKEICNYPVCCTMFAMGPLFSVTLM